MMRWVSIIGVAFICASCRKEVTPIRVAAAADLTAAFEELGAAFEIKTAQKVVFTFGSTGLLAQQVKAGAPFDVFAAAQVSFVDELIDAKVCDAKTKSMYGVGRVVLWSKDSAMAPKLMQDLLDPRFHHIAIANPEHAPYGRAAVEALTHAGLWEQIKPRVVYAENVRQVMQLIESGNVEVGVVALSLVIQNKTGTWIPIEAQAHKPIEQVLVGCFQGAQFAGGMEFAKFVNSPAGRAIMNRYGFMLPTESASAVR